MCTRGTVPPGTYGRIIYTFRRLATLDANHISGRGEGGLRALAPAWCLGGFERRLRLVRAGGSELLLPDQHECCGDAGERDPRADPESELEA